MLDIIMLTISSPLLFHEIMHGDSIDPFATAVRSQMGLWKRSCKDRQARSQTGAVGAIAPSAGLTAPSDASLCTVGSVVPLLDRSLSQKYSLHQTIIFSLVRKSLLHYTSRLARDHTKRPPPTPRWRHATAMRPTTVPPENKPRESNKPSYTNRGERGQK